MRAFNATTWVPNSIESKRIKWLNCPNPSIRPGVDTRPRANMYRVHQPSVGKLNKAVDQSGSMHPVDAAVEILITFQSQLARQVAFGARKNSSLLLYQLSNHRSRKEK